MLLTVDMSAKPHATALDAFGSAQRFVEAAGLAEQVVRGGVGAVKAQLILAAVQFAHAEAHLVGQVEGVAHDAPLRATGMQLFASRQKSRCKMGSPPVM